MSENENVMDTSKEVEMDAIEKTETTTSVSEEVDATVTENTENAPLLAPKTANNNGPTKGQKFAAAIKEWFRKFTVKLKHKPHNIPFVILLITSFMYLCFLGTFSKFIETNSGIKSLGIFQFVNTLASILILLIFLNSFPKRKKVNIVMLVITFVVLALMVVMDALFIVNIIDYGNKLSSGLQWFLGREGTTESIVYSIVHIVFLAFTILMLALLPVYKKLLMRINTSKELASNDIKEEIDTSEENG